MITDAQRKPICSHEYYDFCEWHHRKLLSRSKDFYELYSETGDDYYLNEASDSEWKAADFAWDKQVFIQDYQKLNPEITYKFFKD